MKLNIRTDYSLRVLIFLLSRQRKCKIQEVADYFDISKNHLKVIVNQLSEMGIVHSFSGPTGGIVFNEKFADMRLGDLVAQLEDLTVVDCFADPNSCRISGRCRLKKILGQASQGFLRELNSYKIADLASQLP